MGRRANYQGKSMSQEMANRMGAQGPGRDKLVGRKQYERKEKREQPMKGLGRC